MSEKIIDQGYSRLKKNMKHHFLDEFIYDIRDPLESKELTEMFKTGKFILFGFIPELGWKKVFYQSIGLINQYKLVRKKVFPINLTCGSCAYYEECFCCHIKTKDNCGDRDSDRKCDINSFVSIPYNWDSYTNQEKEAFRVFNK